MAVRKSAEERREEILEVAIRHFADRRLPRHLDRGDRPRGRHLAALPVPPVPHQARAVPRLLRPRRRAADRGVPPRGRATASTPGGAPARDGQGLRRASCSPTATRSSCRCRATSPPSDPEIQAHVRSTRSAGSWPRSHDSPAPTGEDVWAFFATGMLLNVTAALDLGAIAGESEWAAAWSQAGPDHRLRRHARLLMLDRLARASTGAGGRCWSRRSCSCSPPARSAARWSGCSTPATTSPTRSRSRSRRATRSRG